MSLKTDRYFMNGSAQALWRDRISQAVLRIGRSDREACAALLKRLPGHDSEPKQEQILALAPELSKFKAGESSVLRRWFEDDGNRRPYLEAFATLLKEPTSIFDVWLDQSRSEVPLAADSGWHPAFPHLGRDKISIPSEFVCAGQTFSPTALAAVLLPRLAANEKPEETAADQAKRRGSDGLSWGLGIEEFGGRAKAAAADDTSPRSIEGWIVLEGQTGAGLSVAAEQLRAAMQARQTALMMTSEGDATRPREVTFRVHTWRSASQLATEGPGPIVIRRRSASEAYTFDAPTEGSEEPALDEAPPNSVTVEVAPWGCAQVRELIKALLIDGELPEAQKVQLSRFSKLLEDDAILGPERTPQRVIALLGQVARGYPPKDPAETRARLSEAAWEAATRRDDSGALSCFNASLMEVLWSTWLLRETTEARYAEEHHRLDWAFIPREKLGPLLDELTAGHPAPNDPSGALKRALDQMVQARSSRERTRLAEEIGRLAVAGRAEAIVYGLEQGGLLEAAKRISHPGGLEESGWRPTDRSLVTLWATRGLWRRSDPWLSDGWERLMDPRWRPIVDELAALGLTWRRFSELLEGCPPWAAIDAERWKIAFAAASGAEIQARDIVPAWATTLLAVICGTYSSWVINLHKGYSALRYPQDALALRKVSLKHRANLPELTFYPPGALRPWAESTTWSGLNEAPTCLPTFQEAAPEVWARISDDHALDGLEKLRTMVPQPLLERIERWRIVPADADEPEDDGDQYRWHQGLADDERGFQVWTRRALARRVLRWLAPEQHLPWDWDYLGGIEDALDSSRLLLPTEQAAETQLRSAADEGHPVAQWLLAGGISLSGERSYQWSRLAESVCGRWIADLPTTKELWCRVVELGERLGKSWSVTERIGKDGKVIDEQEANAVRMFGEPEYEEKTRTAKPIDLDHSFLRRSKAIEERPRSLAERLPYPAVPESEVRRLVDLYKLVHRQALVEALRDPERTDGPRVPSMSWINPFASRLFCLRLAESIADCQWLAAQAGASEAWLNPGDVHVGLEQSWGRRLCIQMPGHAVTIDLRQPWNAWPLHSILAAISQEERWAREAATALGRLGEFEPLHRRWHKPERWTPGAMLQTALLCANLLRWWALTPPPVTPHLAALPRPAVEEDAPIQVPLDLDEAMEAVDELERLLSTIEVPGQRERSGMDTLIVDGKANQARLTAEQGQALETAFDSTQALASSLWESNQTLMEALGWMNSTMLAEATLQAPRLFSPFASEAVVSHGIWGRRGSILGEPLPRVVPGEVKKRLPSIVRLHFFSQRYTGELALVRTHLEQNGLPESDSPIGKWLEELNALLQCDIWAISEDVRDWQRRLADAAFSAQVHLGDLDLVRTWLDYEIDRDRQRRCIPSAPGVIGVDRMEVIKEAVRHDPSLLDAAWGLDGITEAQRHVLADISTSEARQHPSDHPRPWVFNHWEKRLRVECYESLPHVIREDPRVVPVLESLLVGLPHGRQAARWALDLHRLRPFNRALVEELNYWALEDSEPFRGGDAFWPWPDDFGPGQSPFVWQVAQPGGPDRRADKDVGISFGGLRFVEEDDDRPLGQVNAGGVEQLVGAYLAWCRHITGRRETSGTEVVSGGDASDSLEWTKGGVKRLMDMALRLPAVRLVANHYGMTIRSRLTYFPVQPEVPFFLIDPLLQAAEALGMHQYLRDLYDSPPGPQPGDDECFPVDPEREGDEPIEDRPALIRHWLKQCLGYKPWFQAEPPSLQAPLEARYRSWLENRPDQAMALLCMETLRLIQLYQEHEPQPSIQQLLPVVEKRLVECLSSQAATNPGEHWQELRPLEKELLAEGEARLWSELSMGRGWYPGRALEVFRALAPERALLVEAEVRRRHPPSGMTSLIELGEDERRGSWRWSPSVDRWVRGDHFPV